MKLFRSSVCCLAVLVASFGCSKAESPTEHSQALSMLKATKANPRTDRPKHYYSQTILQREDFKRMMSKDIMTIQAERAKDFAPSKATFVGFKTVPHNGYSVTFTIYSSSDSSTFPNKFACLFSVIEKDDAGIPYLSCPVVPGPSGTFSIPSVVDGIPVICIAEQAFRNCSDIEHLILPDSLQYIGEKTFQECTGLVDITIPSSVARIDTSAFLGCTALQDVCILDRTNNLTIGPNAFSRCGSVVQLTLPNDAVSMYPSSFQGAFDETRLPEGPIHFGNWYLGYIGSAQTHVNIPYGVRVCPLFYTQLRNNSSLVSLEVNSGTIAEDKSIIIPYEAYSGFSNLQSVVIGPNIKEIGAFAFANCPQLTNLVFKGNVNQIGVHSFIHSTNLSVTGFPSTQSPRTTLTAFSAPALEATRQKTVDPNLSILLDCGIVLDLGGKRLGARKRIDIPKMRRAWEQSMLRLETDLDEIKSLPNELESLLCETIEHLHEAGQYFGFTSDPTMTFWDNKGAMKTYEKSHEEILAGKQYDFLLYGVLKRCAEELDHPCAYYWLAKDLKKEGERIKAARFFQKAALGFAVKKCPRISSDDSNGLSHLGSTDNAISECITEIEELGYHTVAESLLVQIQSTKKQANNQTLQFGTAWFINKSAIATCRHVIEDCKEIWMETDDGARIDFTVLAEDVNNDIAILKTKAPIPNHTSLPISSKLETVASKVFTVGYPLPDIMGSEKKYNDGTISALSGIGNDNRFYQISIPIQPGNSGGAVVSEEGLVIGLAAAALDAEKVFKLTGSIPQNVNYAIKSRYITALLQDNGIPYEETPPKSGTDMKAIVDQVSRATILLKAK